MLNLAFHMKKTLPAIILTTYLSAAVFSALFCMWLMPATAMLPADGLMLLSACAGHTAPAAVCPLAAAVATRSSLVAATFSSNAILLLLAILAGTVLFATLVNSILSDVRTRNNWQHYLRRRPPLRLFQELAPLFADGIIQPKLYAR